MRTRIIVFLVWVFSIVLILGCNKKDKMAQFKQFTQQFLTERIPEVPTPRMLTKNDLPGEQKKYFEENNGTLQMLLDLNRNGVPEYLICGASDSLVKNHEHRAYFFAIFEQTENGIERKFLQRLNAPPVDLRPSDRDDRVGVLLIFAFNSNFAAEIYYEDGKYQLERWY